MHHAPAYVTTTPYIHCMRPVISREKVVGINERSPMLPMPRQKFRPCRKEELLCLLPFFHILIDRRTKRTKQATIPKKISIEKKKLKASAAPGEPGIGAKISRAIRLNCVSSPIVAARAGITATRTRRNASIHMFFLTRAPDRVSKYYIPK